MLDPFLVTCFPTMPNVDWIACCAAVTALLILHESLPFGSWKGEGPKADREAVRKAKKPPVYAVPPPRQKWRSQHRLRFRARWTGSTHQPPTRQSKT